MHYYSNVGKADVGTRDPTDRYETPDPATQCLIERFAWPNRILEPACGTGRMARVLEGNGYEVDAWDLLEHGKDFLTHDYGRVDAVVTNPPYKDGLAEAFVHRALSITDGPVAMLLRSGFMSGQNRYKRLFGVTPPSHVLQLSARLLFYYADGSRITGQAHDHAWFVWRGTPRDEDLPMLSWVPPEELRDDLT